MRDSSDRNLLGGVLALQMDFVTGPQLLAAMNAWAANKDAPLLELLRDAGALSPEDVDAIARLVERHLARHGGDATKGLAATRFDPDLTRFLAESGTHALPGPSSAGPSRYRKVRPHARGGLGEVSVALDVELGREVALKEIQPRYADHPQMRARFLREAEITGQLEHPGVVPVYGLGAGPDGRPYYAMRFIGGESLEAAIARVQAGTSSERLRDLLTRFVAVCNAVAYAHSRGIIHRDLKPANVMLGEYGETLVVDWGLARRMHGPGDETVTDAPLSLRDDVAATLAGTAVGTPAYMPPEQAAGRVDELGPRSDVFSLGATLYAILTGKPPYHGPDPLAEASACRPAPARAVRPDAPPALEAVCVKAMAASPSARYASARDLAGEVTRWLADEPVEAYPDPYLVRASRWARRNRTLAASLAVLLVGGVVALAVGLFAVRAEQAQTRKALKDAEDNLALAEENHRLARRAVNECLDVARDHPMFQEPGMRPAKKLLLERTLPFYRDLRPGGGSGAEEGLQAFRVGYISSQLGLDEEAIQSFRRAEAILAGLAEASKSVPAYRHDLSMVHNNLAIVLTRMGRLDEAMKANRRAAELLEGLLAERPGTAGYLLSLARTRGALGGVLTEAGEHEEALAETRASEADFARLVDAGEAGALHGLATARLQLGTRLHRAGRDTEAITAYRLAAETYQRLLDTDEPTPETRASLAGAMQGLAAVLRDRGENAEAVAATRAEAEARQTLADLYPSVPQYHFDLGHALLRLGGLLESYGTPAEALEALSRAEYTWTRFAARYPAYRTGRYLHGLTSFRIAVLRERDGSALPAYRRALALLRSACDADPSAATPREVLAQTLGKAAAYLRKLGRRAEAAKLYLLAEETHPVEEATRRPRADEAYEAAILLRGLGRPEEALAAYRRAVAACEGASDHRARGTMARVLNSAAFLLMSQGRRGAALTAFGRAGDVYALLAASNPEEPAYRGGAAVVAYNLACLYGRDAGRSVLSAAEADKLAGVAINHLRQARALGYFENRKNREFFATEEELNPLRGRPGFKAFAASLPR